MRGIDHLVLAGHDLNAMRRTYEALGFTVTPPGQHPFGTGNALVQLYGNYLELLSVTAPQAVPEQGPDRFSFGAFNRDYLQRHDGFSMLVLSSLDPRADSAAWRAAGLQTYQPFDFTRQATLPDGEEITVAFSLAFVTCPAAPWLGVFACQHHSPDYFAQPQYQHHRNTASTVRDVWVVSEDHGQLGEFLGKVAGCAARDEGNRKIFPTAKGEIILALPEAFEAAFGCAPPHPEDGPHLAGFTLECRALELPDTAKLTRRGERLVVAPAHAFGTAVAFTLQ